MDGNAHPPAPRARNLPLVLLVLLHVAAGVVAINAGRGRGPDWRIVNILALAMGQTLLCSYVATLGRGRLAWRWPLAALLVALVAAFACGCLNAGNRAFFRDLSVLTVAALYTLWLAAQAPLWFLRVRFGWCLARGDLTHMPVGREELQFGIKHILGWTAVVAVLCGMGRWAFTSAAVRAATEESRIVVIFGLLVVFSTLLCVLPLWAGLARDRRAAWWLLTLIYSAIVVGVEPWVFTAVLGDAPRGDDGVLWWLGFVEVASLLASLLLVRAAGFRLVRLATTTPARVGGGPGAGSE